MSEICYQDILREKQAALAAMGLPPVFKRYSGSWLRYLLDGEVFQEFALSAVSRWFVPEFKPENFTGSFDLSRDGGNTMTSALEYIFGIDDKYVNPDGAAGASDNDTANKGLILDSFYISWEHITLSKKKKKQLLRGFGITRWLKVQFVVKRSSANLLRPDKWESFYALMREREVNGVIVRKPDFNGLNLLEIEPLKFRNRKEAPAPGDFLENFMSFVTAETPEDSILAAERAGALLDDVVRRDLEFMTDEQKWAAYLEELRSVRRD